MASGSNVRRAREFAEAILASDHSILGVMVMDSEGNNLAYSGRQGTGNVALTDKAELNRIGSMELLSLRLAPRPGQNSGDEEYVAYAYQNFKIVITELKDPPFVVGLKVTRSSNVEYLMSAVLKKHR